MHERNSRDIVALFASLQDAVTRKNQEEGLATNHPWYHSLTVCESDGLLDVLYHGEYDIWLKDQEIPILQDLLELLASPSIAPKLRSFTYKTAAVLAANGTYDFTIDPLAYGNESFVNLIQLSLDQGEGEHGYKILVSRRDEEGWKEAGALAALLEKAPNLEILISPVPPNKEFFHGQTHPLRVLNVDAGFDHDTFILNLAQCSRFNKLEHLIWTDDRNTYLDEWPDITTPFEDYLMLFRSPIANQLKTIELREVVLLEEQIRQLLAIRTEGVFIVPSDARRAITHD